MTRRRSSDPPALEAGRPLTAADQSAVRRPLVVTADLELRDEVERLCAAVEVVADVVDDPLHARHRWVHASCVLAGSDVVGSMAAAGLPTRPGLVVITRSAQVAAWQGAVELRAEAVVELPVERTRLADLLAEWTRSSRLDGAAACVIGLVGSRGGVGTSTTAATIGLVAAAQGRPAVVVDADADSTGLDLLLGCESVAGLRWPDVAGVNGRVGPEALRSALPETRGLAVLAWGSDGPTELPAGTLETVIDVAGRAAEIVVVDLGRHLDAERDGFVGRADLVVLVAGGDLQSAAGAGRLASELRSRCADLRLAVREASTGGVDPPLLGAAVDVPVTLVLRHGRRTDRAINDGLGPPVSRRDSRVIGRWLDELRGRVPR